MKRSKFLATFMMCLSSAAQAADPHIYIVKKGDTLSTIAHRQIGKPIFSKNGSLAKLLKLNPDIQNADLIFPGQSVRLSSRKNPVLAKAEPAPREPADIPAKDPDEEIQSQAPEAAVASPNTNKPSTPAKFEIPHHFFVGATLGMTTLTSTDQGSGAGATLFSSQDVGLGAGWQQEWSDSLSTKAQVALRSVDFQAPSSGSKSIGDSKKFTSGFTLDAEKKLNSNFSLTSGLGYSQELFLRGLTTTSVGVDAVAVPKLSVGALCQIYEAGSTSLGLKGDLNYLLGATADGYTLNAGMAYQGGIYLRRRYGVDRAVEMSLSYKDRSQNTSATNFHEKMIFGNLIFAFPLFMESESK